MPKEHTQDELWNFLRQELKNFNAESHEEDQLTLDDFAHEYFGTTFHGYEVRRDKFHQIYFKKKTS